MNPSPICTFFISKSARLSDFWDFGDLDGGEFQEKNMIFFLHQEPHLFHMEYLSQPVRVSSASYK